MKDLLDFAIQSAGGMARFKAFDTVTADLHHTGVLWALKQREGVLTDARATVSLHEQRVSHGPFQPGGETSIYTPGKVELVSSSGGVTDVLDEPRSSFAGYALDTPWSNTQLAYFAGYTMWTYLTAPFVLAHPGVVTEEIEPWVIDGLVYRRLRATFPDAVATHSKVQTFYFDTDGRLCRHDYEVDIQGRNAAARYLTDYANIQGLWMPGRFRIYPLTALNLAMSEPLIVGVDITNIRFD